MFSYTDFDQVLYLIRENEEKSDNLVDFFSKFRRQGRGWTWDLFQMIFKKNVFYFSAEILQHYVAALCTIDISKLNKRFHCIHRVKESEFIGKFLFSFFHPHWGLTTPPDPRQPRAHGVARGKVPLSYIYDLP